MIGLKENLPGDVAASQEVLVELLEARGGAEVIEMHTHCEAGDTKSAECLESEEGELERMRLRGRGRRLQMVSRAWRVFRVWKSFRVWGHVCRRLQFTGARPLYLEYLQRSRHISIQGLQIIVVAEAPPLYSSQLLLYTVHNILLKTNGFVFDINKVQSMYHTTIQSTLYKCYTSKC